MIATYPLDVSAGDILREPFEILEGRDWLGFAGIAKARLPAILLAVVATLEELDVDALMQILTEPKNAIIPQMPRNDAAER